MDFDWLIGFDPPNKMSNKLTIKARLGIFGQIKFQDFSLLANNDLTNVLGDFTNANGHEGVNIKTES